MRACGCANECPLRLHALWSSRPAGKREACRLVCLCVVGSLPLIMTTRSLQDVARARTSTSSLYMVGRAYRAERGSVAALPLGGTGGPGTTAESARPAHAHFVAHRCNKDVVVKGLRFCEVECMSAEAKQVLSSFRPGAWFPLRLRSCVSREAARSACREEPVK